MPGRKSKEERELFYAYLRQNSLKKTYQKDLILETFLSTEGHLSVEDLYALIKKRDKRIGIVTVFRTLKSLTACGIAREITLGDGLTRFEHSYHHPHHHHAVCTDCHKTIEFVSPELEALQLSIVQKYHFQPIYHRFQIYGICEECRENKPMAPLHRFDTEQIFARDALRLALHMEKRGIEFYRDAAARNEDASGKRIFATVLEEELRHLSEIEADLAEIQQDDRGLEKAPIFLHFDAKELDDLVPDLREYEVGGVLQLDARQSLELAMMFERRAAEFFKGFATKFIETKGKDVFLRFAEREMIHLEQISKLMEGAVAYPV